MSRHRAAPVDRISDLSDELISHILSFVPIKHAFTTTVLSKRWTKLPYSLPVPTFDDENIPYNDDDGNDDDIHRFCRFIDTNLSVKTFHLKSRFRFDGANRLSFDAWVEAAKQRRFEEVHLIMNNVKLNPTIFTSQTLVVLKLDKLLVEAENLHVDLPSLKTLHLKHVCFEYQNDIKKLLNACPVLEDLHTVYPRYIQREENSEEFESLFLSKLVRAEIGSTDVPFNAIHNVEFLRLHRAQDPSLMNVEEIFKDIPVFQNLIHVELWFYGFFHGWDGVVELLRHCPKLQIIFLRKWNTSLSKDWDCPILGLECVESHLRSCTILNFEGSENDLRFAKYIFQNATLLQDMTIKVAASSSDGKHQIIEELSSCPRMSSGSTLSF